MCIQGRSHIFEHSDLESTASPSHVAMGLPPYSSHDGSMSSSQSISSSNSGRDADTQEEGGEAVSDGASAGPFFSLLPVYTCVLLSLTCIYMRSSLSYLYIRSSLSYLYMRSSLSYLYMRSSLSYLYIHVRSSLSYLYICIQQW